MKKVILGLALLLSSTCSTLHFYDPPVLIYSDDERLQQPLDMAISFLWDRGIFAVQLANDRPNTPKLYVEVGDISDAYLGQCFCNLGQGTGKALLHEDLLKETPVYQSCVIAHEILHAVGMNHVKDKSSLMATAIQPVFLNCPWTDSDQAELERVIENK